MPELGVNIDHVATLRQARKTYEPDPVAAAALAELAGADSITIHLREDRRHIQDRDLRLLRETVTTKLNLELSVSDEIVGIACQTKPEQATLVPERREEVTTEGGLDVSSHMVTVARAVKRLQAAGIAVSLFIDPEPRQIQLSKDLGVEAIELHTGQYAIARGAPQQQQLAGLVAAAKLAGDLGLRLHAGHGLNYHNVRPVAAIAGMMELNIGHSIISRAVLVGLERAVREMKALLQRYDASMSDRYFVEQPITGSTAELVETDAQHLARVMRAVVGDEVILFDGSGTEFAAKVARIAKAAVTLDILERREINREPRVELTLAVALPKGERQKWLVEKLTELGAARLMPLITERGVAQPVEAALARLSRAVIEASKQCGRNRLMEIAPPREASEYFADDSLGMKLVAEPGGEVLGPLAQDVTHLSCAIGPEGGFTPAELKAALENKWRPVSLGRSILRIETAAIAVAAWSALS